jgi:hypothetical protein
MSFIFDMLTMIMAIIVPFSTIISIIVLIVMLLMSINKKIIAYTFALLSTPLIYMILYVGAQVIESFVYNFHEEGYSMYFLMPKQLKIYLYDDERATKEKILREKLRNIELDPILIEESQLFKLETDTLKNKLLQDAYAKCVDHYGAMKLAVNNKTLADVTEPNEVDYLRIPESQRDTLCELGNNNYMAVNKFTHEEWVALHNRKSNMQKQIDIIQKEIEQVNMDHKIKYKMW